VPYRNGRLEVAWRIYKALSEISLGDLAEKQRAMLKVEREAAFSRYVLEGELRQRHKKPQEATDAGKT
jgi:hypothetical protein